MQASSSTKSQSGSETEFAAAVSHALDGAIAQERDELNCEESESGSSPGTPTSTDRHSSILESNSWDHGFEEGCNEIIFGKLRDPKQIPPTPAVIVLACSDSRMPPPHLEMPAVQCSPAQSALTQNLTCVGTGFCALLFAVAAACQWLCSDPAAPSSAALATYTM